MSKKYNIAIAGATGVVGREFIKVLEQRKFPVNELRLLASSRSKGKKLDFNGMEHEVRELREDSFNGIDIALFSAGGSVSKKFSPIAAKSGAVAVDNSSAFRMDPEVPLVVPEVNPGDIKKHKGIIANPNCSTIQMVVALKPLHDAAGIKRIVVSTYQSVSGWGKGAVEQLWAETEEIIRLKASAAAGRQASGRGGQARPEADGIKKVLPAQIAFNVIPHIDVFLPNDYTKEEMKMVNETRKILGDENIKVTATCVRVGVVISHAEAVNIETEKKISAGEAAEILKKAPGIELIDDPSSDKYPMPLDAVGKDATFVGRIREDESLEKGLNLWIVSDNLRKGAALNAVQIAELLIS